MPEPSKPRAAKSADPVEAAAEPEIPVEGDEAGADAAEPEVFANRAERRAHGKGRSTPPPASKGKQVGGRSAVTNPRQYGTRRSGG
jgi:hypothetical protein